MTAIDFEMARAIADASFRPTWRPAAGTFMVSPWGWQDATHWRIEAGAKEYLIDDDPDFQPLDGQAILVDKTTGEVVLLDVIPNFDRLGAMEPVGDPPD